MPEYRFYVDQKVAVWERIIYNVEAECYEDAVKKAEKLYEEGSCEQEDGYVETETLLDSMYNLGTEDNNDGATRELIYHAKGETELEIKKNGL